MSEPTKKRIDLLLVEMGKVPSRTKAQDLLKSQSLRLRTKNGWQKEISPSQLFSADEILEIEFLAADELKYVSRAGLKMEAALVESHWDVRGQTVLDVGISTGGFTDCLLQAGAKRIVGVDVGHDQLHAKLKDDARVVLIEGCNARELSRNKTVLEHIPQGGFTGVVIDVSFISLALILPEVVKVLSAEGRVLALVKPQFELGPENLDRSGIVKDSKLYPVLETKVKSMAEASGLVVENYFASKVPGKDGNREFFLYARHGGVARGM